MKKYTQLLFDLDGTLLDFNTSEKKAFQEVCHHFSIPFSQTILEHYHRINISYWNLLERGKITRDELMPGRFTKLFLELGYPFSGEEANHCYRLQLANQRDLMPDALKVCQALSEHYALSLITNGATFTQTHRLDGCPLTPFFPHVFISEEIGFEKPQAGFFDAVLRTLGVSPDQCLIIGDSLSSDIQGGVNSGIDTCFFFPDSLTKSTAAANLSSVSANPSAAPLLPQPTYRISRLMELPHLLEQLS